MYLLDTNHCSLLLELDPAVAAQVDAHSDSPMATSVITQGELIFMAQGSGRKEENSQRVTTFLTGIRIYQIDSETAALYGALKANLYSRFGPKERAKRRRTSITQLGFSDNDLWIASLAIRNGLILVSGDSDFKRMQEVQRFDLTTWEETQA